MKEETTYIGGADLHLMKDPTTTESIITSCDTLKQALIARYEADKAETNAKLEKIKCHKALTLAKEAINEIRFN